MRPLRRARACPQEFAKTSAAPDAAALKGLSAFVRTTLAESEADFAAEAVKAAAEAAARAAAAAEQAALAAAEAQRLGGRSLPARNPPVCFCQMLVFV